MNKSDPNGHNTGLVYSGYYQFFTPFDIQSGNWVADNTVLGMLNQSMNAFVSVGNLVADPLLAAGQAYAPYSGPVDNMAMTTPIPHDNAVAAGGKLLASAASGAKALRLGVTETAVPRTFASSDPLVASLANEIEAAYPGHVVGVNVPIRNAAGQLVTDADIQLKNAIIQVKSGGGKGLTSQVQRTEQATGKPTIGYGPSLKPSVVKSLNQAGGLVTTDRRLLIEMVRP